MRRFEFTEGTWTDLTGNHNLYFGNIDGDTVVGLPTDVSPTCFSTAPRSAASLRPSRTSRCSGATGAGDPAFDTMIRAVPFVDEDGDGFGDTEDCDDVDASVKALPHKLNPSNKVQG